MYRLNTENHRNNAGTELTNHDTELERVSGRQMERQKRVRDRLSYRVVTVSEAHVLNHNYRRRDCATGRKTT